MSVAQDAVFTLLVCAGLLGWGGWSLWTLATLDVAALLRGGRATGRAVWRVAGRAWPDGAVEREISAEEVGDE